MYAVARLYSIQEKASALNIEASIDSDFSKLSEDSAWEICSQLSRFEEVLERTAVDYEPCNICNYALELAKCISRAYLELRVVGEQDPQKAQARLTLFVAARQVLSKSLEILGITPLKRM